jgi:hypothetical protein
MRSLSTRRLWLLAASSGARPHPGPSPPPRPRATLKIIDRLGRSMFETSYEYDRRLWDLLMRHEMRFFFCYFPRQHTQNI